MAKFATPHSPGPMGREVTRHVSSNGLRVTQHHPRPTEALSYHAVALRKKRRQYPMRPLAKPSLPLNVARIPRRAGRESVTRLRLHFRGYVTVKRQGI